MTEKKIKFKSYDGYQLDGSFIGADKEKAAVIFVHGITSSRDELGFHSDYARYLGENGISSLRFDYRYHGTNTTESNATKLKELSLCGIVNDIDAAFAALKSHVTGKTKSFFIIGTSFGGGLSAFWVDFYDKKEIKKVILNAPVINYEDDVLQRNSLLNDGVLSKKAQRHLSEKGFVNSSDIHFGRALVNELKYINGINPLQHLAGRVTIFHGDDDEDVPLTSSQKYKAKNTTLKIVKGVGHGFGVEDDEDLDFPETKEIHRGIYRDTLKIIESSL